MWWYTVTQGRGSGGETDEWSLASTLHTTSEHDVSSITTADAYTSAASSRLNWRPRRRFKWTRPFHRKRNMVSARVPSHFRRSLQLKVASALEGCRNLPYASPLVDHRLCSITPISTDLHDIPISNTPLPKAISCVVQDFEIRFNSTRRYW